MGMIKTLGIKTFKSLRNDAGSSDVVSFYMCNQSWPFSRYKFTYPGWCRILNCNCDKIFIYIKVFPLKIPM